MELYDSHAHFRGGAEENRVLVDRAGAAGVVRILAVGGDDAANEAAATLVRAFPDRIRAALGFECDQATGDNAALVARLRGLLAAERPAAIGEIGLDFSRGESAAARAAQIDLVRRGLALAAELDRPVTFHTRAADAETLAALDAVPARASGLRGAIHCFTGTVAFGRQLLDRGFCLGVSGIVTFTKGQNVRNIAAMCPADRLLIETDSPYLAPVPNRGQPNEPSFLPFTLAAVAAARHEEPAAVAVRTLSNARALFG